MVLRLRPYQSEAMRAIFDAWDNGQGIRRILVSLPPGTGKTILFSAVARQMRTRTLILAHRDELVEQAVEKLRLVYPEARIGVVKGKRDEIEAPVIVASVQTLARSGRTHALLRHGRFGLVVTDEAHHYTAPSYLRVIEEVGGFEPDGPMVLGVTATPSRPDGGGLDELFDRIVYSKSLLEMVQAGYLCDLRGIQVRTKLDLSGVKLVKTLHGEDFDQRQLAYVVNQPWFNRLVVTAYQHEALGRQALVFAVSNEHAEALTHEFRRAGIAADVVHSRLSEKQRQSRIQDFRARRINVLCNTNILTEGFDEPSISAILMVRPTRSRLLYTHMLGRGTRLYPGKEDCLVLDFCSNTSQSIQTLTTYFGLDPGTLRRNEGSILRAVAEKERRRHYGGGVAATGDNVETKRVDIDLLPRVRFRWLQVDEQAMVLNAGDLGNIYLIQKNTDLWDAVLVKGQAVRCLLKEPLPITYAQGVAEDYLRQHRKVILSRDDAAWRQRRASVEQIDALKRMGVSFRPDVTAGEASDLMTLAIARREIRRVRTSCKTGSSHKE